MYTRKCARRSYPGDEDRVGQPPLLAAVGCEVQQADCKARAVFCWPSTHLAALHCARAAGSSPCASGFGNKSDVGCEVLFLLADLMDMLQSQKEFG